MCIRDSHADDQSRSMIANLTGKRVPVSNKQVLSTLIEFPFMTIGVLGAIVWEAAKLKLKGLRYRPHRKLRKKAHVTLGYPNGIVAPTRPTTKEPR